MKIVKILTTVFSSSGITALTTYLATRAEFAAKNENIHLRKKALATQIRGYKDCLNPKVAGINHVKAVVTTQPVTLPLENLKTCYNKWLKDVNTSDESV